MLKLIKGGIFKMQRRLKGLVCLISVLLAVSMLFTGCATSAPKEQNAPAAQTAQTAQTAQATTAAQATAGDSGKYTFPLKENKKITVLAYSGNEIKICRL